MNRDFIIEDKVTFVTSPIIEKLVSKGKISDFDLSMYIYFKNEADKFANKLKNAICEELTPEYPTQADNVVVFNKSIRNGKEIISLKLRKEEDEN